MSDKWYLLLVNWSEIPSDEIINKTVNALNANGIVASVINTKEEARKKVIEMIPEGSEVMTMSSKTLDELDLPDLFNESGKYDSVKKKIFDKDRKTQGREIDKITSAPDFALGSVHAVTQDGQILVASNTGSQLPAYTYTAGKVIWVVGVQKIVENFEMGMKRLYEYNLPNESKRMQELYGMDSFISKMLVISRELIPGRLNLIFVKEVIGV